MSEKLNINGKTILLYACISLILIGLFSSWEYKTDISDSQEIGKVVSFETPLVVYLNVPKSVAGSTITDKYNMMLEAKHNIIFEDNFKFLKREELSPAVQYEITAVIKIQVIGLIIRSFKGSITYYILKDPSGRLLPMRRGLYEGSEKQYH
jgi:hypothetical protein